MKKSILPVTLFFVIFFSFLQLQALNWVPKLPFAPGNRFAPFNFTIGQKGYIGTGTIQNGNVFTPMTDLWEYDNVNDIWTQKSSLPAPGRYGSIGFALNNFGFITTGYNLTTYFKDTWKYDPLNNQWTQMTNFPGAARLTCAAFTINNYGFVGMGKGSGSNSNYSDFYRYNATNNTWSAIAQIPGGGRQGAVGFSDSGYGYVVGGAIESTSINKFELYQYDPVGDIWIQKSTFPGVASNGFYCFNLNNEFYVGCGAKIVSGIAQTDDQFFKYNTVTDSWTQETDFDGGLRFMGSSLTIGNTAFCGVGSTFGTPNLAYQSDWWSVNTVNNISNNTFNIHHEIFVDDNGILNINFSIPLKENLQVQIFNGTGNLVKNCFINTYTQSTTIEMNFDKTGIYYYKLISADKKYLSGKFLCLN